MLLAIPVAMNAATDATPFDKLVHEADAARQANRLPEAVGLYRQAVKVRPTWSEGWWWLGSLYYDQDLYVEARDAFQHAATGSKSPALTDAFLGLCEYELRNYAAARAHLAKWQTAGAPGDRMLSDVARFHLAQLETQEGRFFEALYQLHREVSVRGPSPALAEAMGLAWMRMKSLPEDYRPEDREMVWLAGSAAAWFSAGKQDRAMELLNQLERYYGDRPNVHFLRGFVFESMKDTDAAIQEYAREAQISPGTTAALIQLALLYTDTGDFEKAIQNARQASALEPDNARAHFAFGRALASDEKWVESAAELEKAEALSPKAPKVHFQLAKVYRKLGREEEARRESSVFEAMEKDGQDKPAPGDPASLRGVPEGRRP